MSRTTRIAAILAALLVVGAVGAGTSEPAGAQATRLKVLILGDSYSAGNGTGDGYFGPQDCYRSRNTWGEQAAKRLGAFLGRTVSMTNRACSGAVTKHFFEPRDMGSSEAGPLN